MKSITTQNQSQPKTNHNPKPTATQNQPRPKTNRDPDQSETFRPVPGYFKMYSVISENKFT